MLFDLVKTMITRGTYVKEDMLKKMDVFLLNNRITETEYNDLVTLMG
ncbi:hypothetical protein [Anaerotignum sp. MB30-C6]|nr:hypothetical protein [Anaerotignum sp. MB30-C6]WMI81853.1 hypothetical protein RBQ60_03750 [Anaerotignum sp. MB30-C6]